MYDTLNLATYGVFAVLFAWSYKSQIDNMRRLESRVEKYDIKIERLMERFLDVVSENVEATERMSGRMKGLEKTLEARPCAKNK